MNNSLLILTTPFCPWLDFAKHVAEKQNRPLQDKFTQWHDQFCGIKSIEFNNMLKFYVNPDDFFPSDPKSFTDIVDKINNNLSLSIISDPRAIRSAQTLMNEIPSMTSVILFERPESLISRELSAYDAHALLEAWLVSAKSILNLVRRYRSRIRLIDSTEALEAGKSLIQKIPVFQTGCDYLPIEIKTNDTEQIVYAVFSLWLNSNSEARRIFEELQACMEVLCPEACSELNSVIANKAFAHLGQIEKNVNQTNKKLEAAFQENDLILLKLHKAQENLEIRFLNEEQQKEEIKKIKINLNDAVKAKDTQIKLASEKQAALEVAVKTKEEFAKETKKNLDLKVQELDRLKSNKKELSEENELLIIQLHQVQEELEHYFLETQSKDQLLRKSTAWDKPTLQVKSLEIGLREDKAPHRHINFVLRDTTQFQRSFEKLNLRLVEHNANPGIVVFGTDQNGPQPLLHWQEHAKEDGNGYMILVPADKIGKDFFVAATTSDLLLLREATALLAAELKSNNASNKIPIHWERVALRFMEALNDIPERLHYDTLVARSCGKSNAEEYAFQVTNAWIHGRLIHLLVFVWHPLTGEIKISCSQGAPPLASWPLHSDMSPVGEIALKFMENPKKSESFALWNKFTMVDRFLIEQIVTELPNFIFHLNEQNPDLKISLDHLNGQSLKLKKQIKIWNAPLRKKNLFRSIFPF